MAAAMRREGMSITVGFASAAQRCPDRPGLVDELGTLTWRQLDERIDALAAALQGLPVSGRPEQQASWGSCAAITESCSRARRWDRRSPARPHAYASLRFLQTKTPHRHSKAAS
jgi:non-ribosomal peptide synthetase component F